MTVISLIHILFSILMVDATIYDSILHFRRDNEAICHSVTRDGVFEKALVIGKPWRTYYTWNVNLNEWCLDTVFKNPNPLILKRVQQTYLFKFNKQPPWSDAVLYMSMGSSRGMLLFEDPSGIPGRLVGVPDIAEPNYDETRQIIYYMTIRILQKGQYLLMSDCTSGVISLLLRSKNRPKRVQIENAALNLNLSSDPFPACITESDPEEHTMIVTIT